MNNANTASASFLTGFKARMAARDLQASLKIADTRKRENAAARARCVADKDLTALLENEAARRGERFSWANYFRNIRIND